MQRRVRASLVDRGDQFRPATDPSREAVGFRQSGWPGRQRRSTPTMKPDAVGKVRSRFERGRIVPSQFVSKLPGSDVISLTVESEAVVTERRYTPQVNVFFSFGRDASRTRSNGGLRPIEIASEIRGLMNRIELNAALGCGRLWFRGAARNGEAQVRARRGSRTVCGSGYIFPEGTPFRSGLPLHVRLAPSPNYSFSFFLQLLLYSKFPPAHLLPFLLGCRGRDGNSG